MKTRILDILSRNHLNYEEEKLFERLVILLGSIEGNEIPPMKYVDKKR